MIELRFYASENGGKSLADAIIGIPRLVNYDLTIAFEPATDNHNLNDYINSYQVPLSGAPAVKLQTMLDDVSILEDHEELRIPLGSELWLEVERNDVRHSRVRLIAGGFYQLDAFARVDSDNVEDWETELLNLSSQIGPEFGTLPGNMHQRDILSAGLRPTAQAMLYQTDRWNAPSLGSQGYLGLTSNRCLVTGIEPVVDDVNNELTSPSLVAHWLDANVNNVALRDGNISQSEAGTLRMLLTDAAMATTLDRVSTATASQTPGRAMVNANAAGLTNALFSTGTSLDQDFQSPFNDANAEITAALALGEAALPKHRCLMARTIGAISCCRTTHGVDVLLRTKACVIPCELERRFIHWICCWRFKRSLSKFHRNDGTIE